MKIKLDAFSECCRMGVKKREMVLSKEIQMELCACGCGFALPSNGEIPNHNGDLYATWECVETIQDSERYQGWEFEEQEGEE